jgi:hypothetical protein
LKDLEETKAIDTRTTSNHRTHKGGKSRMKFHRYPEWMSDERPEDGGLLFLTSVSFLQKLA